MSSIMTHLFSFCHLLRPHPPESERPEFEFLFPWVDSLHRTNLLILNGFLFLGSILIQDIHFIGFTFWWRFVCLFVFEMTIVKNFRMSSIFWGFMDVYMCESMFNRLWIVRRTKWFYFVRALWSVLLRSRRTNWTHQVPEKTIQEGNNRFWICFFLSFHHQYREMEFSIENQPWMLIIGIWDEEKIGTFANKMRAQKRIEFWWKKRMGHTKRYANKRRITCKWFVAHAWNTLFLVIC